MSRLKDWVAKEKYNIKPCLEFFWWFRRVWISNETLIKWKEAASLVNNSWFNSMYGKKNEANFLTFFKVFDFM